MKISQKITTFLWFDSQAEEAMKFYVDVFNNAPYSSKDSKIVSIFRAKGMKTPGMPQMEGKVLTGEFELEGQKFMCLDGGPVFKFNESTSFYVECSDQNEVDYFFEKLSAVPASEICGWLKDKFGFSWQIIPTRLVELTNDKDQNTANKAVNAMLKMKKIDIAELERSVQKENHKEFTAKERLMKATKGKSKICSRGHKYRGSGPCPVCWPGSLKKRKARKIV